MKYISLFSGIGGFEHGIEKSNKKQLLKCIGYSEIDKYAENIYKKHYPNHLRLGDATKINTKELQDNSLNWMWTKGRSKKLVDSNKNSLTLTGGGHNSGANQLIVEKCIGSTQKNASVTDGTVTGYVYDENGLVGTLGLCSGGKGGEGKIVRIRNNTIKGYLEAEDGDGLELGQKNGRGIVQKQSIPTLNCTGSTGVLLKDNEKKITQTEHQESKGTINGFYIRKLTPIETERLQGFPDNWTKTGADGTEISNTQRYKCCGNAVTTNVITYIFNEWNINEKSKEEVKE